ncbi:MAG: hypothetical protein WCK29_02850 [archaeon]
MRKIKVKEPTKLMRVRTRIYSAFKMMAGIKQRPMTELLEEIMIPELKRRNMMLESIEEKDVSSENLTS